MSESLVCINDFEKHASTVLPTKVYDYFRSGSGNEYTLNSNQACFSKFKIRPRCLRNVAIRDLSTTVLGQRVQMPIGVSPTALQRLAHPDGECASARAAQTLGTVFTLSTVASSSIEEIAEAARDGINWLQTFIFKDREVTKRLVRRAELSGFKAIVLTIDCPVLGSRSGLAEVVLPPYVTFPNFGNRKADRKYLAEIVDPSVEWNDINWLQSITKLPIVAKGILTAEDAIAAADAGFSAVFVSNHGARQLDGLPSTIEVLPEIVDAVGHRVEVYLDGGVTDGTAVYKALAMGARMVLVGRPPVWGLAHSGEAGARNVLSILRTELDYALAITGCSSVRDIHRSMVVSEGYYSKL